MLTPGAEVYKVKTVDQDDLYVDQTELAELRKNAKLVSEKTIWAGGSLASYSGQTMRSEGWVARTIADASELNAAIGVSSALRKARKMPEEWRPVQLTLNGRLTSARVNQVIRAITEHQRKDDANMLILRMETNDASFQEASRLASYLAELESEKFFTVGVIPTETIGAATLVPLACDEVVLLNGGSLKPDEKQDVSTQLSSRTVQLVLSNLELQTSRPAALLSVLLDRDVSAKEFIEQNSGRRGCMRLAIANVAAR